MDANNKAFYDRNDMSDLPVMHLAINRVGDDEPDERRRSLKEDRNSYLVDEYGARYDPDSLAWRYLGLYVDCDDNNDNNGKGGNSYCERKLLWAVYHDPHYRGNSIEEYQFYDPTSRTWDDSTCSRNGMYARCARLDCHEANTGFKLVGVFKETDGMYDWTEQLFKHEGGCVWNDDETYQTMERWMGMLPTSCEQLYLPDVWGNTLYMAVKPLPGGNLTLAIYKDSVCTRASSMDITTYLVKLYQSKGYSDQTGYTAAETWKEGIATWNEKMSYFKVCQPCVAYNRFSEQTKYNGHVRKGRLLGGGGNQNNNDGNGYVRSRYNCYDDAGYTNVDQCYKFETKTNLELAYEEDLHAASNQGSILRIKAYGKVYGKGGYNTPMSHAVQVAYESFVALSIAGLVLSVLYLRRCFQRLSNGRRRIMPTSMMDVLYGGDDTDNAASLRRERAERRWIQWTNKGSEKVRKSGVGTELEVRDAETLSTVTGVYDPPTCDGECDDETGLEPSEQRQILENYIEMQVLWNTINDANLGRLIESIADEDSATDSNAADHDITLCPETSSKTCTSDDMNHHDILEDKVQNLENIVANMDIVSTGDASDRYDNIEQLILGYAVVDEEIISSGCASVTESNIQLQILENVIADAEIANSEDSIRKEEIEIISSGSSNTEYSIRTEEAPGATNHLYTIPEGSSLSSFDKSTSSFGPSFECQGEK